MTIKSTELRSQRALGNATTQPSATASATNVQPKRLKALAEGVLGRNQQRNLSATEGVETRNHSATEARQQRALKLLAENPAARYAVLTDTQADSEAVLLILAIRGRATCELRIPQKKWDGVLLLDLIEQYGGTIH